MDEEADLPFARSLFDDFSSCSSSRVWEHMERIANFSYSNLRHLSFYQFIQLINYLRDIGKKEGKHTALERWGVECMYTDANEMREWMDEKYLVSTLEDDRLLWDFPGNWKFAEDEEGDEDEDEDEDEDGDGDGDEDEDEDGDGDGDGDEDEDEDKGEDKEKADEDSIVYTPKLPLMKEAGNATQYRKSSCSVSSTANASSSSKVSSNAVGNMCVNAKVSSKLNPAVVCESGVSPSGVCAPPVTPPVASKPSVTPPIASPPTSTTPSSPTPSSPTPSPPPYRPPKIYSEPTVYYENRLLKESLSRVTDMLLKATEGANIPSSTEEYIRKCREDEEEGVDESRALKQSIAKNDSQYFSSYSWLDIHREMISDGHRTQTYRNFVLNNRERFEGKIVLDVGCGSGILSMFAAEAGAKLVVGIDGSSRIISLAKDIILKNGFGSTISLISGKVEDVDLYYNASENRVISTCKGSKPPQGVCYTPFQCDILISEWMGYCLLYESMVYTVLEARDRFLVEGGWMAPSKAILWMYGLDSSSTLASSLDSWKEPLYGLDLSSLSPSEKDLLQTPSVIFTDPQSVCVQPFFLCEIDMLRVSSKALRHLDVPFKLSVGSFEGKVVTSLGVYFTCVFDQRGLARTHAEKSVLTEKSSVLQERGGGITYATHTPLTSKSCYTRRDEEEHPEDVTNEIVLETGPFTEKTHWSQTVFHLFNKDGKRLSLSSSSFPLSGISNGSLTIAPIPEKPRSLSIVIRLEEVREDTNSNGTPSSVLCYYEMQ